MHRRIHCADRLHRRRRLRLPDVAVAEQELTRQIRLLDAVHVRDENLPVFAAAHAHQRQVLQHLAANGARAHQEHAAVRQRLLQRLAEHHDLSVIARTHLATVGVIGARGQRFEGVVVQELEDGRELARAGLQHLLRHDAAEARRHGAQIATACHGEGAQHRLVQLRHARLRRQRVVHLTTESHEGSGVRLVPGARDAARLGDEGVEGQHGDVEVDGVIELAEVGDQHLAGVAVALGQRAEVERLGLLDLCAPAKGLVRREGRSVADRELLVAQDVDAARRTAVELGHAADVGERDEVALLEGVAIFANRHQTLLVLCIKTVSEGVRC